MEPYYCCFTNNSTSCIRCIPGWWAVVSDYKFLTFCLHLWQASSEMTASTVASEVLPTCIADYLLPSHEGVECIG